MPLHSTFLRYFEGVCHYGSIRKAAMQLHVSPTAINRAILNYEAEINLKLFDRTNEGMKLTVAGKILFAHIRRTLDDARTTLSELNELVVGQNTQIKVGGAESIISSYLPTVMLDYYKTNPNATLSFTPCTTERAIEKLANARIDVAVIFDPVVTSAINIVHQQSLTIGAVILPDHPLASQEGIHLEQCVDYPIIMPVKNWPLRSRLDALFESKKLPINVIMECGSTEMLQSMVNSKIGVGFHTIIGIERSVDAGKLKLIPILSPNKEYQQISLCIHSNKRISVGLQKLIDLLIQDLNSYSTC